MPSKVYSKEQKLEIKEKLLNTALEMYSRQGIRDVTLMDVLKAVGISKPFFYTFFDSVQEFVICVLEYQWTKFPKLFEIIDSQVGLSWEDKIYDFFKQMIYYTGTGFLIMTQEEEVWVRKHINDERYNEFMSSQILFFDHLLERWGISKGKCDPKVLANMTLSMILVHSSAKNSLPFFYLNDLNETAETHARCIIAYLKSIK